MTETEKKFIEEIQKTHTLFNDINCNVQIWVSKTEKINYDELYKILAIANLRIYERQMEDQNQINED